MSYPLISGTNYYVEVTGYSTSTTGYYSIMASTMDGGSSMVTPLTTAGEPDGTPGQATVMSINTSYDRYLTAGDVDWFVFTAP